MELSVHDMSTWWKSCAPITPSTVPCFSGVNNEKRRTPISRVLAPLPRKSIEPMVLAVDGVAPTAVRAIQAFISEGMWDDGRLVQQHWKEVERDLGADDGVLMVDGSDFPKQGVHSVGVKRQYCGELGKRANCQAGVFVGYVRLRATPCWIVGCVPAAWLTDDAYTERRRQCGLPADLTFKTKPELAQEMRAAVVQSHALRCQWVVADEAFGGTPALLDGVVGLGLWGFTEVAHTTRVWAERPALHMPPWRGRGRRPQRARLGAGGPQAQTVLGMASALPPRRGYAGRSRKAAKGIWWRTLLPCGWPPYGMPCQVLTSGWCCVGTSRRRS